LAGSCGVDAVDRFSAGLLRSFCPGIDLDIDFVDLTCTYTDIQRTARDQTRPRRLRHWPPQKFHLKEARLVAAELIGRKLAIGVTTAATLSIYSWAAASHKAWWRTSRPAVLLELV
jgi:hypothetical protein